MQSPKEDTDREPPPTAGLEKSSLIFDQLWTVNIANLNSREPIKTNSISLVDDSADTETSNYYALSCSLLSEDGVVKCCLNFEVQGPLPNSTVGRFTVAIQDKNGQERHVRSKLVQLTSGQMTVEWSSWMFLDYLRQDKKELLTEGLKLHCKVEKSQMAIPVVRPMLRNEGTVVQSYVHTWKVNNLQNYLSKVSTDVIAESGYFFSTTDAIRFKTQLVITETRSVSLRLIAHCVDHFPGILVDCAVAIEGFDFKKEVRQMAFDGETTEFEVATNDDFAGFADLLKRDKLVFTLSMSLYFDEENLAKSGDIEQFLIEDDFQAPWHVKRITDVTTKSEMNTNLVFYNGSRTHEMPLNAKDQRGFRFYIHDHVGGTLTLTPTKGPKTGQLGINLVLTSSHSRDLTGRFRFFLVNNGGPRMFTKEGQVTLKANRSATLVEHILQRRALSDNANGQGNDKTRLRFRCELQMPFGSESTFTQFPVLTVLPSIKHLLHYQMPTDVILHFPEVNINLHAHKAVLAHQSTIFDVMFNGDFAESRQNQVDMKEVDCEAFKELLWFIYYGKTKDPTKMKELAAEIMRAADMYDIAGLKYQAEDYLALNVKKSNALSILEMADMYKSRKLKKSAMEVIHDNMLDLVKEEPFQTLGKRKPDMLMSLYLDLCKKKARFENQECYHDCHNHGRYCYCYDREYTDSEERERSDESEDEDYY